MDVVELLDIVARARIDGVVPCIGYACRVAELIRGRVIDGEVERINLITSIGIRVRKGINAGAVIGFAVPICPCVRIVSGFSDRERFWVMNGQMQCNNTVASCNCLKLLRGSSVRPYSKLEIQRIIGFTCTKIILYHNRNRLVYCNFLCFDDIIPA